MSNGPAICTSDCPSIARPFVFLSAKFEKSEHASPLVLRKCTHREMQLRGKTLWKVQLVELELASWVSVHFCMQR